MAEEPTYEQLLIQIREYEEKEASWQAELAALRASEKRQRRVIENSKAGYFLLDLDGKFRQVNTAWLEMHKYGSADEVLGMHFSRTQVPENALRAAETAGRVLSAGEAVSGEFSRLCKDGSVGWHDYTVQPVRENGRVIGVEGFLMDTTERHSMARAVRESEAGYRALFEHMLDGFALHEMVTDENGRPVDFVFLEVNQAFERIFEVKREEILGKRISQVLPNVVDPLPAFIGRYADVAVGGEIRRIDRYVEALGKWLSVLSYSPEPGRFAVICQDVTERKAAEQALKEKVSQLDLILGSAPLVLGAVNLDWDFILFEGRGLEPLGVRPGEMVGKSALAVYRHANSEILEHLKEAMGGRDLEALLDMDGEIYEAHFAPLRGEDGQINGAVAVALDITERRRAEESLKASEARYRALFENSMDAVLLTAPDGAILEANPAARVLFRCSEEELRRLGREGTVDRDDPRLAEALAQREHNGRFRGEFTHRRADGTTFLGESSSTVFRDGQGRLRTSLIIRDVTEQRRADESLKASEARYRALFEYSMDAVMLNKPDGTILEANQAAQELFRCSEEELRRLGRQGLVVPDEPNLAPALAERERTGHFTAEFQHIRPDGTTFLGEVSSTLFTDHEGELKASVIIRDVTERRRAEQALKESEEHFRAAFTGNPLGMVISRLDTGVWVDVNQPALDILGYTREEVLGRNMLDMDLWIDLEQRAAVMADVKTGRKVRSWEVNLRRRDGREITLSLSVQPLMLKGVAHLLVIGEDVTERKAAEAERRKLQEQLAGAVELAQLGPWEYDVINDVFTFTDRFYKIFGTTAEEVGGYTMSGAEYAERFVHPDDRHILSGEIDKTMVENDTTYRGRVEHRMLYADGRTGYISVLSSGIRDAQGRTIKTFGVNQDVTERRLAEQALRASEARYRTLYENSLDAVMLTTPQGDILAANPAAQELFGCSEQELIRLGRAGTVDPDDPRVASALVERERTGSYRREFRLKRADGTLFLGEVSSTLYKDHQGQSRAAVILRDVTEQRRAEHALKESEELFRAAFMGNPLAVVISRQEAGIWVDVNQTALDMFGARREDVIGKSVLKTDLWADLAQRDAIVRDLESGREVRNREVTMRHRDGRLLTISTSVQPLTLKGERHLLFIAEDITERKTAEAERQKLQKQLADALELAQLGPWEYDLDADAFTFTDQFYRIFKTTAERAGGYTMSSAEYAERFVHPEDRYVVADEIHKAVSSVERDYRKRLEHRMIYADGRTGHLSVQIFVEKDDQGRLLRYYGVNQDITERKLTAERLQKAEKMDALGTLSSGIAHDFNNILAAILGYSELTAFELPAGHPARHNIDQITRAADRAKNLVRQILTFSRKADTEKAPIDLNRAVTEAAAMLERTIPKMISLEIDQEEGLRPVKADTGQMEQLLLNLAGNAADAMAGGGKLIITTRNLRLDRLECETCGEVLSGDYVRLTVADTGHGMTAETKAKIFDPFFTTKGVGKGTGLGLSTVYGIVTGHGGHITCHSRVGKGTQFSVYLPASQAALRKSDEQERTLQQPAGGDETILVVDDEPVVRDIAGRMLTSAGYTVLDAASGEEALQVYGERGAEIDAVLMDLGMPGMGGKACLAKLRELDPAVRVLIASGYIQYELTDELERLGAAGLVSKPYSMDEILARVRGVLDGAGPPGTD